MVLLKKELNVGGLDKSKLIDLLRLSKRFREDSNYYKLNLDRDRLKITPVLSKNMNVLFYAELDLKEGANNVFVVRLFGFISFMFFLLICVSFFSVFSFIVFDFKVAIPQLGKYALCFLRILQVSFIYIWCKFQSFELFNDIKTVIKTNSLSIH